MAKTPTPAFPQTPKYGQATITSGNTALDGTGSVTGILTAGTDGSQVYGLYAGARATVTATAVRFFMSTNGGSTWDYLPEFDSLIPAHTVANTTANDGRITVVDREIEADNFDMPASAVLGGTAAITLAGGIEFTCWARDY